VIWALIYLWSCWAVEVHGAGWRVCRCKVHRAEWRDRRCPEQVTGSAVLRIVAELQNEITKHGLQAPDMHFLLLRTIAIQRRLQQTSLQVRGQRPLHEVRWNAEAMLIRHCGQPFLCASQRQRLRTKELRGRVLLVEAIRHLLVHMGNEGLLLVTPLAASKESKASGTNAVSLFVTFR
jgi:hypothetical protein